MKMRHDPDAATPIRPIVAVAVAAVLAATVAAVPTKDRPDTTKMRHDGGGQYT